MHDESGRKVFCADVALPNGGAGHCMTSGAGGRVASHLGSAVVGDACDDRVGLDPIVRGTLHTWLLSG